MRHNGVMSRIIETSQRNPSCAVIDDAVATLAFGGVVVMPTDSVYGVGCAATESNPAHERIFELKARPREMALPWLIADPSDLARFAADLSPEAMELALAHWPGALTLVVRASDEVPSEYASADGTIALRVPDSPLVREIARRAGPLATTSANLHGQASATSGADIDPALAEAVDLVLDAGPAPIAVESTIVDVAHGEPRILRVGALKL